MQYHVVEYHAGKLNSVIAGCGRNRGTWDHAANTKGTAQKWARQLRQKNQDPAKTYRVEELHGN